MFSKEFFVGNRRRLTEVLPDSLIVVAAHAALQESADLAYPFRQDSSFWYLTGLSEPGLVLVIDTAQQESVLLVPEQNDYQKEWDGQFAGSRFKAVSGVDEIADRTALNQLLRQSKEDGKQICYLAPLPEVVEPYGFYTNPARRLVEAEINKIEPKPKDIKQELAGLRQIKQASELSAIQQAIDVTGEALSEVRRTLSEFKTEKDLERALSAGFFGRGADGHAYEPIVASGKNAAVIHYNDNAAPLQKNGLLLLDVGAKVSGYAADISRTWALSKPNDRQRSVYEAAVRLQEAAFDMLGPGVLLKDYQQKMEELAARELKKLGVRPGRYPHGFSHFLGLDVHDAGDYQSPLKAGSVITVEPGIYLPDEGIGVRIEDDVLITDTGIRNLSAGIDKSLLPPEML